MPPTCSVTSILALLSCLFTKDFEPAHTPQPVPETLTRGSIFDPYNPISTRQTGEERLSGHCVTRIP